MSLFKEILRKLFWVSMHLNVFLRGCLDEAKKQTFRFVIDMKTFIVVRCSNVQAKQH